MWSTLAESIGKLQRWETSFCRMGVGRAIAVEDSPLLNCLPHSWMKGATEV